MTMQRRHFEVIAETVANLADASDTGLAKHWQTRVAHAFADKLALTNPNFDRARFLRACGVED